MLLFVLSRPASAPGHNLRVRNVFRATPTEGPVLVTAGAFVLPRIDQHRPISKSGRLPKMIYHLVGSAKSTRCCSTVLKEVCRCFRLPALPLPRKGARGFRSQRPSCISWKLDCRNEGSTAAFGATLEQDKDGPNQVSATIAMTSSEFASSSSPDVLYRHRFAS